MNINENELDEMLNEKEEDLEKCLSDNNENFDDDDMVNKYLFIIDIICFINIIIKIKIKIKFN